MENVTQVSKDMTKFGYTTLEVGRRMQAPIQAAESTRHRMGKSRCDEGWTRVKVAKTVSE